ncbi:S-adenosyl-L-methionine-dependent methyltransferase [Rhizoclosmatium globosum]|uniref:S-adenosyl-L-methionine-dependent methyltransferase n=1 Tax=Rhizoclosmatium globosum TaxID=329046 RepID=A0A1Y2CMC8_9FUNG|nr:S-adenosyl-L-methionine-dependent methyltransferase [Rhizoclosmatium globosum]|eukprot:ORY48086.1 S-adenosyl-L-methionine-dependent methyltransferase [Rhizoclosmatium globosum]
MRRFREADKEGKGILGREMSDRILRMVYGTMKYLPYIDTILVKTQFLVYNNQFLNQLGLVKVMMFDLMKCHFDFHRYPGIDYSSSKKSALEADRAETVQDLETALRHFAVKLAAAFARVRIERRASGSTTQEMLQNILPVEVREKEQLAVEMSKTLRINFLKTSKSQITEELRAAGYKVKLQGRNTPESSLPSIASNEDCICVDELFNDFLVIPTEFFSDIKSSSVVTEGKLIFQDKASAYGIRHLTSLIAETDHIIDARAGCGTHVSYLASLMKNKGKVFAFESRPSRIQSLKMRIANQNIKNVEIVEEDFATSDASDEKFAEVNTIIIEPPNSGTLIVDKLGYLLQEEEFPNDQHTAKDITSLKRKQTNMMNHAFNFPNVQTILYITRTSNNEENETVVNECIEKHKGDWELNCVMPDIIVNREFDWEIEDCLKIKPTSTGNGVFVACFTRIIPSESESEDLAEDVQEISLADGTITETVKPDKKIKRKKKKLSTTSKMPKKLSLKKLGPVHQQQGSNHSLSIAAPALMAPKLPPKLAVSVERLSVPRKGAMIVDESYRDYTVAKKIRAKYLIRHDSKDVQESDEVPETDDEWNQETLKKLPDADINIFGVSLKKFYEPKFHAIREMKIQEIEPQPVASRWRYPVPNPKPWK